MSFSLYVDVLYSSKKFGNDESGDGTESKQVKTALRVSYCRCIVVYTMYCSLKMIFGIYSCSVFSRCMNVKVS